jgi:hypothetical protein
MIIFFFDFVYIIIIISRVEECNHHLCDQQHTPGVINMQGPYIIEAGYSYTKPTATTRTCASTCDGSRENAKAGKEQSAGAAGETCAVNKFHLIQPRFETGVRVVVGADGRIAAILHDDDANNTATAKQYEHLPVVRLPSTALLPGMVNCHSHAFQRALRGKGELYPNNNNNNNNNNSSDNNTNMAQQNFWTWRKEM